MRIDPDKSVSVYESNPPGRKTAYRENWIPKLSTGWKPCGRVADFSLKWIAAPRIMADAGLFRAQITIACNYLQDFVGRLNTAKYV
jgi:hypothetical protein